MFGVVVVLSCVLAVATSSVNYCGAKMCGGKDTHTFCQYPEGPSPKCVGYVEAKLNVQEKARLLDRLNNRRNVVAMGGMRGFPSAGNMLKLRWVEELAREAQRWADQCRPPQQVEEHDTCRNLYSLTVGQCVASVVGESPGLRVESMVDIWYIQSKLYKGNMTFYVPPGNDSRYYGDFAQIIWAKSYMVGCGRSRFMTHWQGRLRSVERLVCNIAPFGPQPTRQLWIPATPTAACPYRAVRSSVWGGLCDYQRNQNETISLDPSTTLEEHILLNTILEIEENETLNYLGSIDEMYITKLAIATLANSLTTKTHSNSKQRREVVDFVEVIEFHFNDSTIAFIPQVLMTQDFIFMKDTLTTNTTIPLQTEITLKLTTSTYNKEDLTNVVGKTENIKAIKKMPKKEKNNNAEYIRTKNSTTSKKVLLTPEVPKSTNTYEVTNSTSISKDSSTTDDYDYHTYTAVPGKILDDVTKIQPRNLPTTLKNPEEEEKDDYDDSDEPSGSGSESGDEDDDDDDDDNDDDEQSGDSKGSGDGEGSGSGDSKGSGDGEGSGSGDGEGDGSGDGEGSGLGDDQGADRGNGYSVNRGGGEGTGSGDGDGANRGEGAKHSDGDGANRGDGDGANRGEGAKHGDSANRGDSLGRVEGAGRDDDEGASRGESSGEGAGRGEGSGDSDGDDGRKYFKFGALPNNSDLFNYGPDPETVLQLQEALNRIEHDLEPKKENSKRKKVRRELKHKSSREEKRPRKHRKRSWEDEEIPQKVGDGISPLVKMMSLMPKEDSAGRVAPSLLIVLVLCLNNYIV